jgi:hypothetical protein
MPRPMPERGSRANKNKSYADAIRKKGRSGAKGSAAIGGGTMGGAASGG